jgi:hypothetical protein
MAKSGMYFVDNEPKREIKFKLYCLDAVPPTDPAEGAVMVENLEPSLNLPNLSPVINELTSLVFVAVEPVPSCTSANRVEFVPHNIDCLFVTRLDYFEGE